MKRTVEVLNELERAGVFARYAIGGAMAATFYAEPLLTFDLDVFVLLTPSPAGLITLTPIYDALRVRGYAEESECVSIEGVPVQFLPAYNELLEEALREAAETDYDGTPTRVLGPEHLVAICVQTGRDKDRERVRLLREQTSLDHGLLDAVLCRYDLIGRWNTWTP
ncbi:MAG: nucleotidyltransferase [Verrucomicrobiota bacterium]|nr:nucleotidyltransferase [Verrucomicrobiota bacterium]